MPDDVKADRLFLLYGSPECAKVRAEFNMDAVVDGGFRGKDGQFLLVLVALDEVAMKDLLERYGFGGERVPLLVAHDGETHRSIKQILLHLRDNGAVEND